MRIYKIPGTAPRDMKGRCEGKAREIAGTPSLAMTGEGDFAPRNDSNAS